ncbi:unnamed protein product [Timema podura]|uniref:C2H2-type domain-containing protein n=1 Tax=Timema podura TaxID=61482 RepID=A0ABN7NBP3_TIMPD|nr:unnamed protein product [Timema podura]
MLPALVAACSNAQISCWTRLPKTGRSGFDRWHTCALHLWHEHQMDVDLLTCTLCNKYRTVTAVKLANHMKIHGELRGYQCSKCGKAFKQASQLRNHSTMHMDRKMAVVPRWCFHGGGERGVGRDS